MDAVPAVRREGRRHTESTLGDAKLCKIAALTAQDVMTTLARALRTASLLEKEGKITTEQKSQLKRFIMSSGIRAENLIAALETGDTIKLMGILDKAKKKAKSKGRARGVMFRDNIEDVLGTADHYDRECIEVAPRVEARLPPMGPVMVSRLLIDSLDQ
jgi:FlaA1/EpsC-like NDP-sugar epimerase